MKELTTNEMEYISGAGIIDLPCALVDFTIQSALGLVAAGINAGMILASSALETTIDLVSNILGGSPSSLGSILTDHINSLLYAESGVWSNFVYNAATDWGGVVDALQS
ncbi:hypothetical protein ACU63N_00945 [Klebsiella aerogenes]